MIESTTVVALDSRSLEQWKVTLPTLVQHRPELLEFPWLLIFDIDQLSIPEIEEVLASNQMRQCTIQTSPWPPPGERYISQRDKMVTAYVCCAPRLVQTNWWLKIDTDAYCMTDAEWCLDDWFKDEPAYVANPWGYSKVKGDREGVDGLAWARRLEAFGDAAWPETQRLNLEQHAAGQKIFYNRMTSWISFYNTRWSREIMHRTEEVHEPFHIPVPSQDTFHWYCAARRGDNVTHVRFSKLGWRHPLRRGQLV